MKKVILNLAVITLLGGFAACSDDNENASPIDTELNTDILEAFSANVAQASYNDLKAKVVTLSNNVEALSVEPTDGELTAAQNSWRAARQSWEQTESFLFGPVASADIDPRIDSWPVNFQDLEGLLADEEIDFTDEYINSLDQALKGFHPIEYLIFGEDGDKAAADLNEREIEFLVGLTKNLKALTTEVADSWNPANADNYHEKFITAGAGSEEYETQKAAFQEMVAAMAGICDEVANGKIGEVYDLQDPTQEESPFSENSLTDFTNNMKGVQNVYLGKYSTDGVGLEDLVKKYNLSLDTEIKTRIAAAIQSLENIDGPFGEAIFDETTKVQNAIDAINSLKDLLDDGDNATSTDLHGFVTVHAE